MNHNDVDVGRDSEWLGVSVRIQTEARSRRPYDEYVSGRTRNAKGPCDVILKTLCIIVIIKNERSAAHDLGLGECFQLVYRVFTETLRKTV